MIPLQIIMEGDGAFKDIVSEKHQAGAMDAITMLESGMVSGKNSIAIHVKCDDGSSVIAQTSWTLLHAAVRAFEARYGRPA